MNTYEELWNDIKFVEKRLAEQEQYIHHTMERTDISSERLVELLSSAIAMLYKFDRQRNKLLQNGKNINPGGYSRA